MWYVPLLIYTFALTSQGFDHPSGEGSLEELRCTAQWSIVVPEDRRACPFYFLLCTGEHTHPPPPPVKTPGAIMRAVTEAIAEAYQPGLTAGE
jgi:hypothetical protein